MQVGEIVIGASVAHAALDKDINKSKAALGGFAGGIRGVIGAAAPLAAALLPILAVAKAVGALNDAFGEIDATAKTARTLGVTIDQLRSLQYNANLSGVEVSALEKGLEKLAINTGRAAAGNKKLTDAFSELGISQEDLLNKSQYEIFEQAADGIASIDDASVKAAVSADIFGKAGVDLTRVLEQGSDGLASVQEEFLGLAGSMSQEDAIGVERFNDAVFRLKTGFDSIIQKVAIELAPLLEAITNEFVGLGINGANAGDLIISIMRGVIQVVAFLADGVQLVKVGWYAMQVQVSAVGAVVLGVVGIILKGIQELYNFITDSTTTFGDTTLEWADAFAQNAKDSALAAADAWNEPSWGQGLLDSLDRIEAETKAAAAEMDTQAAKQALIDKAQREAQEKRDQAGTKLIDKLQQEVETFGMGADAAKIYQLQQDGVSESLIMQAEALQETLRLKKEDADRTKEMAKAAEALIASLQTPLDKYKEQLTEINGLLAAGLITPEQASQATDNALPDRVKGLRKDMMSEIDLFKQDVTDLQKLFDAGLIDSEELRFGIEQSLPDQLQSVLGDLETPLDKFLEKYEQLNELRIAGLLDEESFQDALNQAGSILGKNNDPFAEAVTFGSQAARLAVLRGNDTQRKDLEKIAQEHKQATEKGNRELERIANAVENGSTVLLPANL